MLNTININLKTDIKTDKPTSLPITLMSQDKNNNRFILRFTDGGEAVTLDDTYTVEVLTEFRKSRTSRLTTATVMTSPFKTSQDYATWEFDTTYITQDETVYNYVYVRKTGSLVVSADSNAFYFEVGLSEIDKTAGRVAETYDKNYEKYLDEFKGNVDLEEIAQVEGQRESAETIREANEEARELSESERENAEAQRKIDHANRSAELAAKADKKQEDWITPTLLNGATGTLQYRKNDFGRVEFKGDVQHTDAGNAAFISLPNGYRMPSYGRLPVVSYDGISGNVTTLKGQSRGALYLTSILSGKEVSLNSLTFEGD